MKLSCFRITWYTVVNSALEVQNVIKSRCFTDGILSFTWEIRALPFLFPKAVCLHNCNYFNNVTPLCYMANKYKLPITLDGLLTYILQ